MAAALLLLAGAAPAAAQEACDAPAPVCETRAAVFAVSGFDPFGSAVRIGPDLLVSNRHLVADEMQAKVHLADGSTIVAEVVPSSFAGDLILLRAALPDGPVLTTGGDAEGDLYAVAQEIGDKSIQVFPKGQVLLAPDPAKPMARLHHTAYSQPGTSGGALVNARGELVGIVASGGEGRYEAIPFARIAELQSSSGPAHAARNEELGRAYRDCIEMIEMVANGSEIPEFAVDRFTDRCTASENRQIYDMAGQVFGRARKLDRSAMMFERSLDKDPNAVNSRLGYVVALIYAGRHADAIPHVRWLIGVIPEEPQVHQYAVQAGKFGGDRPLAEEGLALIARYNPAHLEAARRFLDAPLPPARRQP